MLCLRQLRKSYAEAGRTRLILNDVNLDVGEGEFLTVRGPSGSGKSTLLNILGALDAPDSGEIRYEGRRLDAFSEKDLVNYRRFAVGTVFQFFHLFPRLTVLENVLVPAFVAGRSGAEARQRARDLVERVGLGALADKTAQTLSGGEMQRTAIARALANGPRLLLADEPTGNLDSANARAILELLVELHRREKLSIVLVTHDESVFALGDTRYHMRDGALARV